MKRPRRERRPTKLGRYDLIREIGRGGMGVIYEARDLQHDRRVAVKVLPKHGGAGGEERVKRFQREVQTIAMLSHPGIVRIFDVAEDAGRYYYVMEFVEGRAVKEMVEDGGVPLRRGLEVIAQMCDALQHAHEQGIIHRDVNPNNILVDTDGRPVLIDFGIAKLADTSRLTRAGATIGTPRYLSPEQALGERDVDGRTDVYGLGATLYLLSTGRPPFAEEGGQTVSLTALERGPTAPRSVNGRVPREVELIIRTAMARKRDHRYADPAEMAEDIRSYLETGQLAIAHARGLPKPVVWGLAAALVLLVGGGVAAMFGSGGPPPARSGGSDPAGTSDPGPKTPPHDPGGGPATDPGDGGHPTDPAAPSGQAMALLAEADGLRDAGKHAEAVRKYFQALQEGAPRGRVLLGRAESNAALKKWALAVEDLEEARRDLKLENAADQVLKKLASGAVRDRLDARDYKSALALMDGWLKVDNKAAGRFHYPLHKLWEGLRRESDLVKWVRERPDSPATLFAAAFYVLHKEGDGAKAVGWLTKAVITAPSFAMAWRLRAGIRMRAGEAKGALADLEEAKRLVDAHGVTAVVERYIFEAGSGYTQAAARTRQKALADFAADPKPDRTPEQRFALAVVERFNAWNDPLAAGNQCDGVFRAFAPNHPVEQQHRTVQSENFKRWLAIDEARLPSEFDRRWRKAVTALDDPALAPDAVHAMLTELETLAHDHPMRYAGAAYHVACALGWLRLGDLQQAVAAAATGLQLDPGQSKLLLLQGWDQVARDRGADAVALITPTLLEEERAGIGFSPRVHLLAIAQAAEQPAGGIEKWLKQHRRGFRESPELATELVQQYLEHHDRYRPLARDRVPFLLYEAGCAVLLEDWGTAATLLQRGAARLPDGCPASSDGGGPTRLARGLARLAEEVAGKGGRDRAVIRRLIRPFYANRAAWDRRGRPEQERRGTWMSLAKAAFRGSVPGRAYQAIDAAQELGAEGRRAEKLRAEIETLLRDQAESGYDMLQLGKLRRYSDPRGARETFRRARLKIDDGSMFPAERDELERIWTEVR